ncbi:helix-turn-helix domain-containing protein [Chitinophaga sp. SYP-B3965]|uniref:helix-turn-helix domain-containing protein n=1 Tax=Chitinophaga sp. SYP-B3965 TaxID=2663120 RepID=UPI001299F763|nr:helix-turn-helix transcriptional regulator [Chitinophaga sp. SYP-B3965]MRG44658.1 helix-turn-helix domain-containing protein [Chitinophaga sp. SYP-B3965]
MKTAFKLYIKGMVCLRCIQAVRGTFLKLDIPVSNIQLGELTTVTTLSAPDVLAVKEGLQQLGFELLEDKRTKLVQEVKVLVQQVYNGTYDFPHDFRFSDIITAWFKKDYAAVSKSFSAAEGTTLERYIMEFRIEKTKEFLVYTGYTMEDIAFRLGFSSAAHLSRQFKSITGLTPSHFKEIGAERSKIMYN